MKGVSSTGFEVRVAWWRCEGLVDAGGRDRRGGGDEVFDVIAQRNEAHSLHETAGEIDHRHSEPGECLPAISPARSSE